MQETVMIIFLRYNILTYLHTEKFVRVGWCLVNRNIRDPNYGPLKHKMAILKTV
jgi:hypothetical protein